MKNTLTAFVSGLKTAQIVNLYNLANEKKVTKFTDRKTAEGRMLKTLAPNGQEEEYRAFAAKYGKAAKDAGIELPTLTADKPAVEVITDKLDKKVLAEVNAEGKPAKKRGRKAAPKAEGDAPAKQNTPPHLNLRCGVCGYYAKTTPAMMKLARLVCPVDHKHGKLLTAEERGEKRGR